MSEKKQLWKRFSFNAPGVLTFAAICVIVQIINSITQIANRFVFAVGGRSFLNPLTYLNCVCHIFGHANWEHLFSNMMYILLIGPILEEKYGTINLIFVMLATAIVTGLGVTILFPNVILCGASGVAFAMILLISITGTKDESIPITFVLVAVLYLGREVYNMVFMHDSVSQLAHIAGGVVGSLLGFVMKRNHMTNYRK